jgi:hypothetical protein
LPLVIDHAVQRPAGISLKQNLPVLDRETAQLTCRANQGHADIIARTIKPAPKKPERASSMMRRYLQRWFRAGFAELLIICLERNLTRRANQGHTGILARIFKARAAQRPRAFSMEIS